MAYKDYNSYMRGRSALLYFHNKAVSFSSYKLTFDELVNLIDSRTNNHYFVEGLGDGIILGEVPEFNVRSGMEKLATQGYGKIPASNSSFTQAIANNVRDNISYVDAAAYTAIESSKEIGTGALEGFQTIGNSVKQGLEVFQFATKYWYVTIPIVIGGYVYFQLTLAKKLKS